MNKIEKKAFILNLHVFAGAITVAPLFILSLWGMELLQITSSGPLLLLALALSSRLALLAVSFKRPIKQLGHP